MSITPQELLALEAPQQEEQSRRSRRRHRETVVIPRLRMMGSVALLLAVLVHNAVLLDDLQLPLIAAFGGLQAIYLTASTYLLVRYYREGARPDLGTVFLALDIAIFVLAIYASGGERSWLFAVLCVRVADQTGTSQRRAFAFASIGVALHALLVLFMAFVEQRGFSLASELTKVGLVYLLNIYLSLAAGPGEHQRRRANRMAEVARSLIDELKRKTEQLEAERARAEAASEAKSAFLANMSHEIRTPMTAVLGMADLLLAEPLEPQERGMVETILTSGRSLLGLVNDVLDMSKIEAGKLTLNLEEMELPSTLQSAMSPMGVLAQNKGIELVLDAPNLPTRQVCGDPLRLRQVLFNLLGNAIKFTKVGSVRLQVRAEDMEAQVCRVHFTVTDTGIGMTPEQLARACEPFQQADLSTTRQFGGTGLGLSIVTTLVDLMGGVLRAESEPGVGSSFGFDLNFEYGQVQRAVPDEPLAAIELLRARAPHVLVAEDTEINRVLLSGTLQHLGCTVESVADGSQAVARLRLSEGPRVDMVFMDWHMPVMDGLEAVTRIRREEAQHGLRPTPVVCVTASAFVEERKRCRAAGMDEVLSKPLVRADLERVLCRFTLEPRQRAHVSERPFAPTTRSRIDRALLHELAAIDSNPAALLRGLFDDLSRTVREHLPELAAAIEKGDLEDVVSRAHSLRGCAAGLGATCLSACFHELEHRARNGDRALLSALAKVERELEHTQTALEAVFPELTRSTAPSG